MASARTCAQECLSTKSESGSSFEAVIMRNLPFSASGRFKSRIFSPSRTAIALRAKPSEMLLAISSPVTPLSTVFSELSGIVRIILDIER